MIAMTAPHAASFPNWSRPHRFAMADGRIIHPW